MTKITKVAQLVSFCLSAPCPRRNFSPVEICPFPKQWPLPRNLSRTLEPNKIAVLTQDVLQKSVVSPRETKIVSPKQGGLLSLGRVWLPYTHRDCVVTPMGFYLCGNSQAKSQGQTLVIPSRRPRKRPEKARESARKLASLMTRPRPGGRARGDTVNKCLTRLFAAFDVSIPRVYVYIYIITCVILHATCMHTYAMYIRGSVRLQICIKLPPICSIQCCSSGCFLRILLGQVLEC